MALVENPIFYSNYVEQILYLLKQLRYRISCNWTWHHGVTRLRPVHWKWWRGELNLSRLFFYPHHILTI